MPIHFEDQDVISEIAGLSSALIVPCNMCPAVTVALRENRPFMQLYRSFLKSAPFEDYLTTLQSRLGEKGVSTEVFRSNLYHQWFMCMWTPARQKKLRKHAKRHDAVIVLGCDSATVTVRDAVESTGQKVIEGMKVSGIMNAKLRFQLPGNLCFDDCKTIPISQQRDRKEAFSTDETGNSIPTACQAEQSGGWVQEGLA